MIQRGLSTFNIALDFLDWAYPEIVFHEPQKSFFVYQPESGLWSDDKRLLVAKIIAFSLSLDGEKKPSSIKSPDAFFTITGGGVLNYASLQNPTAIKELILMLNMLFGGRSRA